MFMDNVKNVIELEREIGSEVSHFLYRVPKKNHDAMMQLNKQFVEIMRKYGATHLILQLNNTEAPMEGITNISKTVSGDPDDEVWMELIFYKDRKHLDDVEAKMRNDVNMEQLFKQSMNLITPGSTFIMGEFSRLSV
jgi:uncharacterized protein YbaA (DUF1428 family)